MVTWPRVRCHLRNEVPLVGYAHVTLKHSKKTDWRHLISLTICLFATRYFFARELSSCVFLEQLILRDSIIPHHNQGISWKRKKVMWHQWDTVCLWLCGIQHSTCKIWVVWTFYASLGHSDKANWVWIVGFHGAFPRTGIAQLQQATALILPLNFYHTSSMHAEKLKNPRKCITSASFERVDSFGMFQVELS